MTFVPDFELSKYQARPKGFDDGRYHLTIREHAGSQGNAEEYRRAFRKLREYMLAHKEDLGDGSFSSLEEAQEWAKKCRDASPGVAIQVVGPDGNPVGGLYLTFVPGQTTQWNKSYPKPDRSNHKPQQDFGREFYPEADIARFEVVLNDGRPAVIEDWFDLDLGLCCRTAFYSTIGTEGWLETDHYSFLEANGLLWGKTHPGQGAGLTTIEDASGSKCWNVTVVMKGETDDSKDLGSQNESRALPEIPTQVSEPVVTFKPEVEEPGTEWVDPGTGSSVRKLAQAVNFSRSFPLPEGFEETKAAVEELLRMVTPDHKTQLRLTGQRLVEEDLKRIKDLPARTRRERHARKL